MTPRGAGALRERVEFDAPVTSADGHGGQVTVWTAAEDALRRSAEMIYRGGDETLEAARLEGREVYKVRMRQSPEVREITNDWRMRHPRTGRIFNVLEVDVLTDRAHVTLVVEVDPDQ